jgi:hypothetical protein
METVNRAMASDAFYSASRVVVIMLAAMVGMLAAFGALGITTNVATYSIDHAHGIAYQMRGGEFGVAYRLDSTQEWSVRRVDRYGFEIRTGKLDIGLYQVTYR